MFEFCDSPLKIGESEAPDAGTPATISLDLDLAVSFAAPGLDSYFSQSTTPGVGFSTRSLASPGDVAACGPPPHVAMKNAHLRAQPVRVGALTSTGTWLKVCCYIKAPIGILELATLLLW